MFRKARQVMHLPAANPQTANLQVVAKTESASPITLTKGARGIDCLVLSRETGLASKAYLSKFPTYRYTLRQPWATPTYLRQWTKYLETHDSGKHVRMHYEILSLPTVDAPGSLKILGQHWHKVNDCPICNEEKIWDEQALIARCREMNLDPFSKRKLEESRRTVRSDIS